MAAREDVLANTLHVLSSSSKSIPLRFHENGSVLLPAVEGDGSENEMLSSCDVLLQITQQVCCDADDKSALDSAVSSMVDGSEFVGDDIIWAAGLTLIQHIISGNKIDNLRDESSATIEPHILLSTLMDSYYYGNDHDHDDETLTPLAMFHLRSLLAAIAIEKAVQSTEKAMESSATIRWRRLRSMIDDVTSLFKKMLHNQLELASKSKSEESTQHTIATATNIYVNYVLPPCRNLLQLLLENASDAAFITRISQTSYICFGVLTILVALQFAFVADVDVCSSVVFKMILRCINNVKTDSLFRLKLSKQRSDSSIADVHKVNSFCLWNKVSVSKCQRGINFAEDLLLYPTICVAHDCYNSALDYNNEDFSNSESEGYSEEEHEEVYDSLGVAVIAYMLQTKSLENETIPSSFSKESISTLYFPHVKVFLSGMTNNSATLDSLHEDEFDESRAIGMGVGMLEKMMTTAPTDIKLSVAADSDINDVVSTMMLASIIEALLSTVMRLSMFEASAHNNPNADSLKYSSRQVMVMTQTLLDLHTPIIRTRALASLSQKMKCMEHTRVLLPRVLDWIRPVVMKICPGIIRDLDDAENVTSEDVAIILEVVDATTPFLSDLECVFDKSKPPLPKDVPEFMSMTESYTSLLSVFRSIRMWSYRAKSTIVPTNDNRFCQIESWISQNESLLKAVTMHLADLLDFWSRACSPRDAKVCVGDNMEPPTEWQRLFLLLNALEDALYEFGATI